MIAPLSLAFCLAGNGGVEAPPNQPAPAPLSRYVPAAWMQPRSAGPPAPRFETPEVEEHFWTGREFNGLSAALVAGIAAYAIIETDGNEKEPIQEAGDNVAIILPAAAVLGTIIMRDGEGFLRLAASFGTQLVFTQFTKETAKKWRPDVSNDGSFISGHSAAAWSAASFINTRYGNKYGIPAMALATWTSYTRVHVEKHFMSDVLSGASAALLINWAWVKPLPGNARVTPVAQDGATGVGLTLSNATQHDGSARDDLDREWDETHYRFSWEFGPSWQQSTEAAAPSDTGTPIDFTDFLLGKNRTTEASASFEFLFDERSEVLLRFTPYEYRDFAVFPTNVSFNGTTFNSGDQINSSFLMFELRSRYRYNLLPESPWDAKLGAGAGYIDNTVTLASPTASAKASDETLVGLLHANVGYHFGDHFLLFAELDAWPQSDNELYDAVVALQYRLNENWDFSVGYRKRYRKSSADSLAVKYDVDQVPIGIGYSF